MFFFNQGLNVDVYTSIKRSLYYKDLIVFGTGRKKRRRRLFFYKCYEKMLKTNPNKKDINGIKSNVERNIENSINDGANNGIDGIKNV
jgi:hypothetical protein